MSAISLSLAVVGINFPNPKGEPTRRFAIDLCRPGDPVELAPEPKNPADPNAVKVLNGQGMQMGYLTAERAPWIGAMIRQGREIRAIFQAATDRGAWIRVAFDGAEPVLPVPANAPSLARPSDAGDEWYPDEVYPDE